jgi:hypothetical protein
MFNLGVRVVRNWICKLALLLFGGVSIVSVAQAVRIGLPLSAEGRRAELRSGLVGQDLAALTESERQRLVGEFEQDLRTGYDWLAERDSLAPPLQERFDANLEVLLRAWLEQQLAGYLALEGPELQSRYLDRMLDDLLGSAAASGAQASAASAGLSLGHPMVQRLLATVNRWDDDAPRPRRAQIESFKSAVMRRILERTRNALPDLGGFQPRRP